MLKALVRGVVAGIAGTGAMTAYQLAVGHLQGKSGETPVPRSWAEAPAPAQVAKKAADLVGQGTRLTRADVPWLTDAVHWLTGVGWGVLYGTARAPVGGLAFGSAVWGASYAELVPLGIYRPPWKYPAHELALDLSYHLVYGMTVAGAYAALDR